MAKITPKSKKVKGTKKKDTITWKSSSAKYKIISVYANNGNDVINFKKSKYSSKLYGQSGNDVIYGGKKNDTIDGGKGSDRLYGYSGNDKILGGAGNDTIYTGKGTNTVVINKGDGNDTIYHQGTKTVIKVNGAKANDTQAFEKKGNDLLLTYTHGGTTVKEVLTFKNFFTGNKNIFLGNKKLENLINSKGITINGSGNIQGTNYNDIINGAIGDDFIIGGKGNDIINAGAGRNTIVHGAGDGNDLIVSGGGNDKLSFGGVNSIDDITATFIGDDVIFTTPNGETVTLQNALANGHSVDTVEIGDDKYTADRFKNYIISSADTINGTAWHDDIQIINPTYKYTDVYAGDGNDIIHVVHSSNSPDIHVGAGDDTISLDDDQPDCMITFKNGDGNNTLTGLSDSINSLNICLNTNDDILRSIQLNNSFSYDYVTGTRDGYNLVLALTGGETFTIENYYGVSQYLKDRILKNVKGKDYSFKQLNYDLKLQDDIITVDAEPNKIYGIEESSNKLIIAPEADFCRFIDILADSNNNDIVIKGQEETLEVYSSNNNIYLGGGSHSIQLYGDGLTGNKIYFYADGGSIRTSNGGSTHISAKTDGYTSINSFGTDTFYLEKGQHYIFFRGNYDETVTISKESKEVKIYGVEVAKSTTITQYFNEEPTDIMFEHYAGWKNSYNYDYLSVRYFDKNGAVLNGDDNNELLINGKWEDDVFNLDNATVGDKVTVKAIKVAGNNYQTTANKTLSEISQYVDMNNSAIATEDGYKKYTLGDGVLNIAKGVYINGTTGNDYYTTGEKSIINLDKSFTVSDKGGNEDILSIDNNYQNTRFFMDIDINQQIASDDLYIFYHSNDGIASEPGQMASGLFQYFSGNIDDYGKEKGYIVVENEFDSSADTFAYGTGRIEHINASDAVIMGGISIQDIFNTIKSDVAGWLGAFNTEYGTSCNTVTEAIESEKNIWSVSYKGQNLYQIYSEPYNM